MAESQSISPQKRNMLKRNVESDWPDWYRPVCARRSIPNRFNSPPVKKRKLYEQIESDQEEDFCENLSCQEKEAAELKEKLEEAEGGAEYYQIMCKEMEEEVEELEEEIKNAKEYAEFCKRKSEYYDSRLQELLLQYEADLAEKSGPVAAVEERFAECEEISCSSDMGYPPARPNGALRCERCGDEEVCVMVLPCSNHCLCSKCESEAESCASN